MFFRVTSTVLLSTMLLFMSIILKCVGKDKTVKKVVASGMLMLVFVLISIWVI